MGYQYYGMIDYQKGALSYLALATELRKRLRLKKAA